MTIEFLTTVMVPFLAAVFSLIGSLFSEINQRSRIKNDIEIYQGLISSPGSKQMIPGSLSMLSEHIERELSMLTGGKARWTCLPRALLLLTLGGALFFALVRFAPLLNLSGFLSPLYVYAYFLLLVLGALCLTSGLKNLYRYIALKSHLLLVLDDAQTSLRAFTKLAHNLSQSVNAQRELSNLFRRVAITLEDTQTKLGEESARVSTEYLDKEFTSLRELQDALQEQKRIVDKNIAEKRDLFFAADSTLRNADYIEDRTLFSLSLNWMRKKLGKKRSELIALEEQLIEIKDNIAWCQGAVDEAIRLHKDISECAARNKRVVLEDSSGILSFDTSEELYAREHLENFFSDLSEGRFEIIRANGPRDTLVIAQQNAGKDYKGHRTLTVLGFLTAKNGQFPSCLRISHAPVRHVP